MKLFVKSGTLALMTFITAICQSASALDIGAIVRAGLKNDPVLREKRLLVDKALLEKRKLRNAAILPKFEAMVGIGPAPTYSAVEDSTGLFSDKYDFGEIRPLFGTRIDVLQPLNIQRLRCALEAADGTIGIARQDVRKAELETSRMLQNLCYRFLYAMRMKQLAEEIRKNLRNAVVRIEAALDDGEADVSQEDLFEVQSYLYKTEDELLKAERGMKAARCAVFFSISPDTALLTDSSFAVRDDRIPPLDTLLILQNDNNPDLRKLSLGIDVRTAMKKLRKIEMFPDVYMAGNCKLSRILGSEEDRQTGLSRLLDPFYDTDALLGIGLRFSFNVWSRKDEYLTESLELEELLRTGVYAQRGLALECENYYYETEMCRARIQNAEKAVRTTRSWLNSALMKYDLDPARTRPLFKAYDKYVEANTEFCGAVLDYNCAVADLITSVGLTADEYQALLTKPSAIKEDR